MVLRRGRKLGGSNLWAYACTLNLTHISSDDSISSQPLPQNDTNLNMGLSRLHIVDQSLRDIAKEFRFTVEEVQEYYDRCGEMGRTRTRFQKMRQELSARFTDDDAPK
jgi:hypothetical protein